MNAAWNSSWRRSARFQSGFPDTSAAARPIFATWCGQRNAINLSHSGRLSDAKKIKNFGGQRRLWRSGGYYSGGGGYRGGYYGGGYRTGYYGAAAGYSYGVRYAGPGYYDGGYSDVGYGDVGYDDAGYTDVGYSGGYDVGYGGGYGYGGYDGGYGYGGCHTAYIPYGWTWYRASSC